MSQYGYDVFIAKFNIDTTVAIQKFSGQVTKDLIDLKILSILSISLNFSWLFFSGSVIFKKDITVEGPTKLEGPSYMTHTTWADGEELFDKYQIYFMIS